MSWWQKLMPDSARVDRHDSGPDYEQYARLAEQAERADTTAAGSLEQAFYDFTNALNDPRRRESVHASLQREPRWLELAARFRRGPCELGACALLDEMPSETVAELITRHPLPPVPAAHTDPAEFFTYRSNEHSDAALWDRVSPLRVDGELRAVLLRVAMTKLEPVARNADRITERLRHLDWPVQDLARRGADVPRYDDETVDAPDRGDLDTQLASIERMVGSRLPVTLEAFWRVVGAIDWSPEPDERLPAWAVDVGVERIDPLCVGGLDGTWYRLDEWSEERERMKHPELAGSPRALISPDRFHKMGISGGASYQVELDGSVDPRVLEAPENLRFLLYLQNALRWGGLPGIAHRETLSSRARDALEQLTADLEPF